MPDRPLILFPSPKRADREHKTPVFTKTMKPSFGRQFTRLQPSFNVLKTAFEQKALKIQQSPTGINPEFALVFEIIGTVDNFYTAVKNTDGLEWIFDSEAEPFNPDDDFYQVDKESGKRVDDSINGKLYCVMSNQQAMSQLLSLWQRHQNGEKDVFKRGFAGLRDVFTHIKDIRKWDARDRIEETHALDYWRESLEFDGDSPIPFEIELFFRNEATKRNNAAETIRCEVQSLDGHVIQECVIGEIFYHGMLVELPRASIEDLVNRYENIELSQVDDIMFFRPVCQSVFVSATDSEMYTSTEAVSLPTGDAVVAVFDGMPMQNHQLLRDRVIIDDPDDYATGYESKYRVHGTSMVSLAIYGDIKRNDTPISSPVYVRPILRPKQSGFDKITECVPDDRMFIDVLHRAVKRMMEGDGQESATAPNTKVINLSIGDPVRQLASTMSPTARLLDFLAYKYKILFIISAGNHPEIVDFVDKSFEEIKSLNITQRSDLFGQVINDNQRNLKILAPAESLNGLTIGALYDDFTNTNETERFIWAVDRGLPSPISAIGKGYRSVIAPDLFYYGGREFIRGRLDGKIDWVESSREPGCLSAAPYGMGDTDGCAFSFGTSDAAAQITHEAAKCHDVLNQVFFDETGVNMPVDATAILLKAMLTHGASWEPIADKLALAMGTSPKQLSKWLGNGVPNISRVVECTKERITLIGLGALKKDEGDIFRLPLPVDFSSRLMKRKLTVTLSYLSPVAPNKQTYRGAQLWFNIDDGGKGLIPDRQNTEWQAVRKGSLQHEIFIGENPIVWNDDDLIIKVNCKEEAIKIRTAIPYCLFVSFEVAEGFDVDLYTNISAKIRQRVHIPNN
ncbi:MAG: S8 family peptidase [Firmicutes bacterium]|nr:S8 family peptidase [Bacillota bacterium]